MEKRKVMKVEAIARIVDICMLVLTACLIGTDSQSKIFFHIYTKKVTLQVIDVFVLSVYVHSVAAGYNLVQLAKCCFFLSQQQHEKLHKTPKIQAWICFLLDQMVVYVVFATNCGAAAAAFLAVTGAESLSWEKVCNIYTKFCVQMGSSIFCGFLASLTLASNSAISSFLLFAM